MIFISGSLSANSENDPYPSHPKGCLDEGSKLNHTCHTASSILVHAFLAHLSWKLKWAFLIACRSSSVCPSVRPSVCLSVRLLTFHIFNFFSRTTGPISSLGGRESSLFKWRATPFSICSEIEKFYSKYIKIFFSITAWPN